MLVWESVFCDCQWKDGEIAALINHWHGRLHGGTIVDTFLRLIGMVNDVLDILLAMAEQPHEIGRSAEG